VDENVKELKLSGKTPEVIELEPTLLTADQILLTQDLTTVDVKVPEWKGYVRLRMLSGVEAAAFIDADKKTAAIRLVQMSIIDKNGKLLFDEDQIRSLQKKSWRVFIRLQDEALKLNGLGPDGVKNV
jgi:hypothetical protein